LPLQDNPLAFIFLVVFSLWLSFVVVMAFLRRELL
jgi:hypothetical protein